MLRYHVRPYFVREYFMNLCRYIHTIRRFTCAFPCEDFFIVTHRRDKNLLFFQCRLFPNRKSGNLLPHRWTKTGRNDILFGFTTERLDLLRYGNEDGLHPGKRTRFHCRGRKRQDGDGMGICFVPFETAAVDWNVKRWGSFLSPNESFWKPAPRANRMRKGLPI